MMNNKEVKFLNLDFLPPADPVIETFGDNFEIDNDYIDTKFKVE